MNKNYEKCFEHIVGYEGVKQGLYQIVDMIKNPEIYTALGATIPRGVMLYGEPGVGKSISAQALMDALEIPQYIFRGGSSEGSFSDRLHKVFTEAKANSPSVILLDDVDKFQSQRDCKEEFTSLQTELDAAKNSDVFIIATANDIDDVPRSLLREGRFDRKYEMGCPSYKDTEKIISYYTQGKEFLGDILWDDITKLLAGNSVAMLETVLNEASILAGYRRSSCIETIDIIKALLKTKYGIQDSTYDSADDSDREVAYHEAAHAMVSELLEPDCIALVSISYSEEEDAKGFMRQYKHYKSHDTEIKVSLAGKIATEIIFKHPANGATLDLESATKIIKHKIADNGTYGFEYMELDSKYDYASEALTVSQNAIFHAELERYSFKVRNLIIDNLPFLNELAETLLLKGYLLNSEIKVIREKYLK